MEPVEGATSEDGEMYEDDDVIYPDMVIKTNYGGANTSQLPIPIELSASERENIALNFFSQFHYYNGNELVAKRQIIEQMQRNYGIPITGELDDATLTMMLSPRCGNSDAPQNYHHFPGSPKWWMSTITYKIAGYSSDLSPCRTRNIIRRAFRVWSEIVELDFVQKAATEKTDITIYFAYGRHQDPWAFDRKDGLLAHAFPPGRFALAGDTHFDESELWTLGDGPIRDTYFGNSRGAPCVFPFTYKGKKYNSCVTEKKHRRGLPWCSTTSNYDTDKKFGFCPSPGLFTYGGTGEGKRCQFPFIFQGTEYTSCTTSGRQDGYKWCGTTGNFDKDKKWGFCPDSRIEQSRGRGRSLLVVAAHEFGHAIGLHHSSSRDALMYPTYKYMKTVKLSNDDINGARSLYSARKSKLPKLRLEKCSYKRFH